MDPQARRSGSSRGRAAAGRDPEDALPRRPDPDPGRADGRAGAAGGGGAVPDAAGDDRRRPSVVFISHKLDEVAGDRRPDDRAAPRQGHRRRHPGRGRDQGRPRPPDGRPGGARASTSGPRQPGPVRAVASTRCTPTATAACRRCGASRWRCAPARSSGIAAVAGNGQTELAEVITGLRAATGTIRIGAATVTNRPPGRRHPARAWPTCRRTGPASGSAPNLSLTDNLIMKRYRQPPVAAAGSSTTGAARTLAEELQGRTTRSPRRRSTRRRACSRAATSSG